MRIKLFKFNPRIFRCDLSIDFSRYFLLLSLNKELQKSLNRFTFAIFT